MQVTDLEGRTWTVRRRWLPRHENLGTRWLRRRAQRRYQRRLERERRNAVEPARDRPWTDLFDFLDFFDELGLVLIGLVLVGVLLFWGVPALLAVLDVVFVALLTVAGVLARLLLRRPWTLEALSGEIRLTRPVVGWFASGRARSAWAEELRHGRGQEGGADGAGLLA